MQPPDDFNPVIGAPEPLLPGLRRIVAPNPSPMTYRGTNTYLLGTSEIAVIDPGPQSVAHLDAILGALEPGQKITHIIVTHAHLDHSPLAGALQKATGAETYAFGPAHAGRSEIMQTLAQTGLVGGGEGIDIDFAPDVEVKDGDVIHAADWQLDVIHTPGHIGNHICLGWNDNCFTADHVMGWASSLVSPPDGDLTDFMASCARLQMRGWQAFFPGHGEMISNPEARLAWLIAHRKSREAAILEALQGGDADAHSLARIIYTDTPDRLMNAAARNVLAHLIDLKRKDSVEVIGKLSAEALFRLK
ncbi:MBL fold metallo-hydrolase [uncultured Roseobacter sp.]|uniref:MBL fold metallo-hydrolase n=1 Tax=uncultured Roseobacter sp. TaxID=114847 RepID=UPI00260CE30F|nr:MBL fold metallo-hydrolase [uncultured Roseobacter sp.]